MIKGQRLNPGKGVLQGAILSGALANLYLTEFDRLCLSHGLNLVRYGDDFVVASNSWMQANRALEQIAGWLGNFYLNLQPEKTHIFAPDQEFTFLGYQFRDGMVIPPPPPPPSNKRRVAMDSGSRFFFLPLPRKAPVVSQPPKACSLVKTVDPPPTTLKKGGEEIANPKHIWSDMMTTLYVTDQGAYLSVYNRQFEVFYQKQLLIKVPANRVSHIVLFGCCNLSHGAVSLSLQRRIPVMYLSQKGVILAAWKLRGWQRWNIWRRR